MGSDDFNRLFHGPDGPHTMAEAARRYAKSIADQRKIILDLLPKIVSGERVLDEKAFYEFVVQCAVAMEAAFLAMQFIYTQQTGEPLDNFAIDGIPPAEPPSED